MTGPSRPDADAGAEEGQQGAASGERRYDSFIVRLWREVGRRRLLRVEVEHTQSEATASGRGVEVDWIGARIADLLDERRSPGCDRKGS